MARFLLNKTKYFRLRLSDEVSTERPETDLKSSWRIWCQKMKNKSSRQTRNERTLWLLELLDGANKESSRWRNSKVSIQSSVFWSPPTSLYRFFVFSCGQQQHNVDQRKNFNAYTASLYCMSVLCNLHESLMDNLGDSSLAGWGWYWMQYSERDGWK